MSLKSEKSSIAAIVLAAGESRRMGEAKQLLRFRGESFIRRSIDAVIDAGIENVLVVLGANAVEVADELAVCPVKTIVNENWSHGMGSSIACGMNAVLKNSPDIGAVLITVCDQPFVDAKALGRLINEFTGSNAKIAASQYAETFGVPAVLSSDVFVDLLAIPEDRGAKTTIKKHLRETKLVSLPEGAVDVDLPDDYRVLLEADFLG